MKLMKCAGIAAAVVVLAIGAAVALAPEDKTVQIMDTGFVPDRMDVMEGGKVVWKNMTQKEHTVTAKMKSGEPGQEKDKPSFDSGPIKPGASWEYTFTKAGTFEYYCTLHPKMTGTVVVKSAK